MKITFEEDNWMTLLDSMRQYGDGLLIGTVEIDGKRYENVGIRYEGNKAYRVANTRNPLYIRLDYINKNQNHEGFETIKLSRALRDPSMLREVLGYEIARKYMPAPQANFATLSINDAAVGLFVNLQAVDEVFLKNNFGSSENSFFACSPSYSEKDMAPEGCKKNLYSSLEYESKASCYTRNFKILSKDGWDDLIELSRVLGQETEKIEEVLHVDRTLWMLAFNNVLVNLNSYSGQNSKNYFLYKDDLGRFNPVVADLNLAFGSFKNIGGGSSDLKLKELQRLDPLLHADNATKPLISKLLSNPNYKKIYLSHLRTIVYDNFESDWYEKRATQLQAVINMPYFNSPVTDREYSYNEFQKALNNTTGKRSKIPGIIELMNKRSRFLKKHAEVSIFPPSVEDVLVAKREKFSNETVKDFKIQAKVEKRAKRVTLFYRYNSNEAYREVFMVDDGTHADGEIGDKIFGAIVKAEAGIDRIEYFIFAENAAAASFSPANYMFEPYTSNLAELNK